MTSEELQQRQNEGNKSVGAAAVLPKAADGSKSKYSADEVRRIGRCVA
jgi:hypothetical protein